MYEQQLDDFYKTGGGVKTCLDNTSIKIFNFQGDLIKYKIMH